MDFIDLDGGFSVNAINVESCSAASAARLRAIARVVIFGVETLGVGWLIYD